MKRLLDTHAFLWADGEPAKLSATAKAACEDPAHVLLLSVVSVWEMQLKIILGKLAVRAPLRQIIQDWIRQSRLEILPLNLEHVLHLDSLPAHHKDPFDRLLIAQAQVEGCDIVSQDRAISRYPVKIIW